MMRSFIEERIWVALALAGAGGNLINRQWPFPAQNALLQLVLWHRPWLYHGIKFLYVSMCFTTPYILSSVLGSLVYIFLVRTERPAAVATLPAYPDPAKRESLFLVL